MITGSSNVWKGRLETAIKDVRVRRQRDLGSAVVGCEWRYGLHGLVHIVIVHFIPI